VDPIALLAHGMDSTGLMDADHGTMLLNSCKAKEKNRRQCHKFRARRQNPRNYFAEKISAVKRLSGTQRLTLIESYSDLSICKCNCSRPIREA
jgi:hypothetical protein